LEEGHKEERGARTEKKMREEGKSPSDEGGVLFSL